MIAIAETKFETELCSLIEDTFNLPPNAIGMATRPDEVDGWDSLGHSVLLTRVSRKLGLPMSERLAAPVENVGEFAARLAVLQRSAQNV